MSTKRIVFHGDDVEIEASGRSAVRIGVRADMDSLLSEFTASEIVQYIDVGDLLDAIGEQKARDHFDMEEV